MKIGYALVQNSGPYQLKRSIDLLIQNFRFLYNDSHDDGTLQLQFSGIKTLGEYFLKYPSSILHAYRFFATIQNTLKDHYIFSQPFLSSLLLLDFLSRDLHFKKNEILPLFLISCLKDVGMSTIPPGLLAKENLTEREKEKIGLHSIGSFKILEDRVPLESHYLLLIKNHHLTSNLASSMESSLQENIIWGFESSLINVCDTLTAMLSHRPYRQSSSLFSALLTIKGQMGKEYSQEFKRFLEHAKIFYSRII